MAEETPVTGATFDEVEVSQDEPLGLFADSLYRNNKRIRQDRADQIIEDAEIKFKRKCEDIALMIKQLQRDRAALLDLSPTDARSLVLASDFNSDKFVDTEVEIGVKIRNYEIKLNIATERFKQLFGKTVPL